LLRAVRYYKGAISPIELLKLPSCWITWANTAEAAEAEGERIAADLAKQEAELKRQE
jgi:hypothetical protein